MAQVIDVDDVDDETMSLDSGHVTVFSEDFSDDEGPASPEDSGCTPDSGCFFYGLYRAVREGYSNVVVGNNRLTLRIAEDEAELANQKRKVKKKAAKHSEKK